MTDIAGYAAAQAAYDAMTDEDPEPEDTDDSDAFDPDDPFYDEDDGIDLDRW